ncbi:hypothetical protein [Nocardia sp. CA-120079]|uniref:hypothetical protein n=1 Tax=Nocardia sp. CA-120079 TaxID=3239974 RepID=UPI003D974E3C
MPIEITVVSKSGACMGKAGQRAAIRRFRRRVMKTARTGKARAQSELEQLGEKVTLTAVQIEKMIDSLGGIGAVLDADATAALYEVHRAHLFGAGEIDRLLRGGGRMMWSRISTR